MYACASCAYEFEEEEDVTQHSCVERCSGEEVENKGVLWERASILALLAAYESRLDEQSHPKKQSKFWANITNDLRGLGYNVSVDQVRWKFNALKKNYKKCIDNNKKSGRGIMRFPWFDRMEDILHLQRTETKHSHTISSLLPFSIPSIVENEHPSTSKHLLSPSSLQLPIPSEQPSTSQSLPVKTPTLQSSPCLVNPSTSQFSLASVHVTDCNENTPLTVSKKRQPKTTFRQDIGGQYIDHLKVVQKKNEKLLQYKEEEINLKKSTLVLREKELVLKEKIMRRKLQEKAQRHKERMEIEKEKCRLLRNILNCSETPIFNDFET